MTENRTRPDLPAAARPRRRRWPLLLLAASLLQAAALQASSPADTVSLVSARLENILQNPSFQGDGRQKERLREIQRVIADHMDVGEMGKRALGVHWHRWPERQEEIVSAFADFLTGFLAGILESHGGAKIVLAGERVDEDFSRVDGKAILSGGTELPVACRLRRIGKEWKIYDVLVYEISLLSRYRSRFGRLLNEGSLEALLQRLQERGAESGRMSKRDWLPMISLLLLSPAQNPPRVQ